MTRIPRDLIKHLEWIPGSAQPPAIVPPSAPVLSPSAFSVEELADRFVISPISYRDGLYRVAWGKEQLDGGKKRPQDDWNTYLSGSEWRLASGPLQVALLGALYAERDGAYKDLVEKVRSAVDGDYDATTGNRAVTGTRVFYSPQGLDRVVHEYGTPDAYDLAAGIMGPDGWLKPGCGYDDAVEALVGMKDFTFLNEITQWVRQKDAYIWRINSTPSSEQQRALVLGVVSDRFYIDAISSIVNGRPARGVAVEKISSVSTGVSR